jgi:hypothetical protein
VFAHAFRGKIHSGGIYHFINERTRNFAGLWWLELIEHSPEDKRSGVHKALTAPWTPLEFCVVKVRTTGWAR